MSLTKFVEVPDVAARLKPLRPKLPRKLDAPIKVEPRSARYALVGTAFDYLLRFELERHAPQAITRPWAAETASEMIVRNVGSSPVGLDLFHDADPSLYLPPEEVAKRARALVSRAKSALATYRTAKSPSTAQQEDMAAHALRLAKLDSLLRAGRLDPDFETASTEDVQDLVALLAVVPYDQLMHKDRLLLNPTFGQASLLVGGADADLIAGNLLVDFKVSKRGAINPVDLDQLLGYFMLARQVHSADATFPTIERAGFYYARHGYLWSIETTEWTSRLEFAETEKWFFERAAQAATTVPTVRKR